MSLAIKSTLLRHARRAPTTAVVERYSTIRTFFRQQPYPSCRPPLACQPISTSVDIHLGTRSIQTRVSFRQLSFAACRRGEHKPPPPREGPEDGHRSSSTQGDPPPPEADKPPDPPNPHRFDNYPPFFRRLALSLPHLHRPTQEDFLRAAGGFWQRLRVRFKWLTIRSFRRYNADDISAFVTWFFMSQTLWLLLGTTTFFSVVFATANSLRLQEYVARALSDYITAETGITIIFESAIVPKWKDSRISFKHVYVTRRPKDVDSVRRRPVDKDAGHRAAVGYDVSNHPSNHRLGDEDDDIVLEDHSDEDTNYTMFDLNVDSIDVTLSFARWFDGKGLVVDAVVKGVRGVIDRRSVTWDPEHPLDPASFRHQGHQGDFELESLELEDVLVTVYQPSDFRPYTFSIFRADIRTFRKQWIFYDFLAAENVVGQLDNCLFSLHRPQSIGRTTEQDLKDGQWARMSRFRMDGLNIDHLQSMTTHDGPFSWLTSGKVDAVLDIKFPHDPTSALPLNELLGELADALAERIPGQRALAKPPLSVPASADDEDAGGSADAPRVVVDIDLRFRDLKAAVPLFTSDLSYVNNALIRPIVAFMNANRTLVPIRCRVVKDLSDFDGAWTMWETGLMDAISIKVYEAMAYHVTQANFNRRIRAVSAWSLQMTASAVLSALRTLVDPMATHFRELYDENFPFDTILHANPLMP
ncbi:mitochondrial distribution and morphology protein-domain-containing protein [Amylocystis lapponica]|nr:mitochondrial distribution and morphology protein-domain-containing protein [Amylocystis lapponica]